MGLFGISEFLPNNQLMALLGEAGCKATSPVAAVCENVLFLIAGPNVGSLDPVSQMISVFYIDVKVHFYGLKS